MMGLPKVLPTILTSSPDRLRLLCNALFSFTLRSNSPTSRLSSLKYHSELSIVIDAAVAALGPASAPPPLALCICSASWNTA